MLVVQPSIQISATPTTKSGRQWNTGPVRSIPAPFKSANTLIITNPSRPAARADFAETLYWNPLLITGSDGKATIEFDLCDAVAKFRVLVDAHVCDPAKGEGRIGSGSGEVIA